MIIDDSKKIVWDQEVMNDIENMVLEYKHKIDFQQQADWGDDRLKIMQEKQKESLSELDEKLKSIEKLSSKMYNNLYSVNKTKVERRDSVSFSDEGQQCSSPDILVSVLIKLNNYQSLDSNNIIICFQREQRPLAQYPPARNAKINRNNLQNDSVSCENIQKKGSFWCALRSKIWAKCKLLEVVSSYENATTKNKYRVQFLDNLPNSIAIVGGFEIANTLLIENFVVGTRVIADFSQSKNTDNSHILGLKKYLPGVILEKQTNLNKRRYLVHSEYGHYRYIAADSVLKIVEQFGAAKMAEIHPKIRYLMSYHMSLMKMTQNNHFLFSVKLDARVPVELNGSWRNADVAEIDCSLVKVRFIPENLEEWLYCGSKRWGPVQTQATRSPLNFRKQNGKSISFIAVGDDGGSDDSDEFLIVSIGPKSVAKKSTAKKSTQPVKLIRSGSSTSQGVSAPLATSEPPIQKVHILNDDKIYIDEPPQVSILRKFTPRKDLIPKQYVPHTCSRHCCPGPKPALASYSTLTKPLLSCWERQIVKHKTFKHIIYKAPCGRRLRNMNEIHKYLKITQNRFNVDNFDYDPTITVMTFYGIKQESCGLYLDDLAGGKEGMPIPVVNAFDNQQPPDMQYSSVRIPTKNVRIDKDPGFLMCCDCTDDCADKSKCACFQNTIAGAKFRNIMDLPAEDISYKFKRLHNMVQTGIYECNINCKCNERCFNRVVQQPIQIKMQLYRTKNRGWGLECLHDIPKGTFICTYVGYLYPEKEANALCANEAHGDEYFAELDYIENVQGLKEGYEAGVQFDDTDDDEDEKNSDSDSDYNEQVDQQDDDITGNAAAASKRAIATRSSTQTRPKRSGSGKQGEQTGNETLENQDEDDLTTEDSETLEEQHKKVPKPGTSKSDSSSDDEDQSEAKKDHINLISDDETIKSLPDEPVTAKPPSVNMVTKSIRKMFGPKEKVYILDAKQCGNVGRYFNVSILIGFI